MLCFDQAACGTSTTGTGTVTFAAPPTAMRCADPYAIWSGSGFGTSQGIPIAYSIVEYTDSTLTSPKQSESGVGTLLFGGSLTACTLARTTILQTATSMDSPPATVTGPTSTPSAITIGTAANVVIYFGPESWNFSSVLTKYHTSGITSGETLGFTNVMPPSTGIAITLGTSGTIYYCTTKIDSSALIKSVTLRNSTSLYTGGSNSLAAALYDIDPSTGLPGKLLLDFGSVSGVFTTSNTNSTFTAAAAVFVPSGYYIIALLPILSGGSGTPNLRAGIGSISSSFGSNFAQNLGGPLTNITVASQSGFTDPATLTSATAYASVNTPALAFRST